MRPLPLAMIGSSECQPVTLTQKHLLTALRRTGHGGSSAGSMAGASIPATPFSKRTKFPIHRLRHQSLPGWFLYSGTTFADELIRFDLVSFMSAFESAKATRRLSTKLWSLLLKPSMRRGWARSARPLGQKQAARCFPLRHLPHPR